MTAHSKAVEAAQDLIIARHRVASGRVLGPHNIDESVERNVTRESSAISLAGCRAGDIYNKRTRIVGLFAARWTYHVRERLPEGPKYRGRQDCLLFMAAGATPVTDHVRLSNLLSLLCELRSSLTAVVRLRLLSPVSSSHPGCMEVARRPCVG